jgi:hypothetical protein
VRRHIRCLINQEHSAREFVGFLYHLKL